MNLDIADTIIPRSDQQNYEDYLTGPRTVTITEVTRGNAEQPVVIHLKEFPDRPYKPSKSMRRVLVSCWGRDASQYVGRRMELYGDPKVMYAGEEVGGIKIRALSGISEPKKMALTVRRGMRAAHVVKPLPDAPPSAPAVTEAQVAAAGSVDELRGLWQQADAGVRPLIEARVQELQTVDPAVDPDSPFEQDTGAGQ